MADSLWGAVPAAPMISARATKPWYRPTFSPEHGVLLVLLGAVLTGASLAQQWTWETTVAASSAFLALQAEHPLVVQLKQRRQWRPRYVVWALVYGGGAIALAGWLIYHHPVVLWLYGAAALAVGVDVVAVLQRRQKTIDTEIVLFVAICLSSIFVGLLELPWYPLDVVAVRCSQISHTH
ncbi:MAG: YwiC-like family protein [Cyanobacteria bacterium J06626_23]